MSTKFVHLHTHSHYSLLDGLSKLDGMIEIAKKDGMPAIGLTDHGNMYGAIEFYKKCKKAGIKPIIGVEAYVANRTRFDKESGIDNKRYHLTLLAKNNTGYKNLIKMVTLANTEGYYYKPRMDKDLLMEHAEGIICLSGCPAGELGRTLQTGNFEKAKKIALEYQKIFGKENYFLEVMHHPTVEHYKVMSDGLRKLSKELNIPLVGTQDSHHLRDDDAKAHKTLIAVSTASDITDTSIFSEAGDDYSFIDTKRAVEYFKDFPGAVETTAKIAEMCDVELDLGTWVFPDLKIPEGTTYDSELKRIVYAGLEPRKMEKTKEVVDRIEYELDIIKVKGYSPYFLVVADIIRHARKHNIYTSIRGSVAGSMTTYLLGITNVEPLSYKLPFERFLNPERPSAPDIDMDFADNRRDEMIQYVKDKYGDDKVAQIGTFGTMMARGSVRDVARALGFSYETGDRIARLIPLGSQGFPMTIKHAMEMEPELQKMYDRDKDTKEVIDLAKKLEGCVRHISVHAAGVVIAPTPLTDFVPTQYDPKGGKLITQYDMHAVEDAGLLKFDFLGIKNLAILGDAVRLVKIFHDIDIDIENIPFDDKKTFEMLARGETMGLFQLNGGGMTKHLKDLRPSTIHDINAMVALYRPGPMESIPEYIKRKHNPRLVKFLDPRMRDILSESFGVITYQDDVMMIAIKLAGYSWLEADMLRKAMGKKIPEVMEEQKEKLLKGFVEHGLTEAKAQELWHLIEPFAAYGFNKAHAASYGRFAYQTAYMKANYPTEYMTAVLTADSGDTEKVAEIISECKRMDTPVLPPDVNESFGGFTVVRKDGEGDKIRFGLYTIKNLGAAISDAIIEERKKNGRYNSFPDFLERVGHKDLNKKSLEALIKSGAMDGFGESRGRMLFNVENALEYNKQVTNASSEQASLFDLMDDQSTVPSLRLKEADDASKEEQLKWEKELLGLFISGHPLDKHRVKLEKANVNIKKTVEKGSEGSATVIAGIVEEHKAIITKKGDHMAFMRVSDFTGSIEVVVFPSILKEFRGLLDVDKCVAIQGRISKRNDSTSVIAEKVKIL